jgi:hypothetical protein
MPDKTRWLKETMFCPTGATPNELSKVQKR